MDDEQPPQKGLLVLKKGNQLSIKGPNKWETPKQLTSCCMKLLEDGSPKNGVIYFIYFCVPM
jgi:hypothetical protein